MLKPAEYTPLTALAFAAICVEADFPQGVVNIVTGDGATGAALVAHAGVDKIAFTGSTEVGRAIRKATAGTGKKLSLELGGKSPFIVFEDADLDSAVEGAVDAIWFNQGQVCCAGSRLLVAEGVAEALYAKLRARMANLRVGDPLDKSTDVGAIVAPAQLERIERLMRRGRARRGSNSGGPTMRFRIAAASIRRPWSPESSPLRSSRVRKSSAPFWSRRPSARRTRQSRSPTTPATAWRLPFGPRTSAARSKTAARIKAGVIWINSTNMFDAASGFGGYRESGFGREGGREGMCEYRIADEPKRKPNAAKPAPSAPRPGFAPAGEIERLLDRTAKLYIGGKQARPDSGYSYAVVDPSGREVGLAGLGNRKDIRNAVEAAAKASSWGAATAHNRAQVLYYVAENLSARADEFARRLQRDDRRLRPRGQGRGRGFGPPRVFLRGLRRQVRRRGPRDALALRHAGDERTVGRHGHRLPERSAASRLRLARHAGDRDGQLRRRGPVGQPPLERDRLLSVLDTSDVPAGVVNIVTGEANALAKTLAEHDGVDALWYVGRRGRRGARSKRFPPAISRRHGPRRRPSTGRGRRPRVPAPGDPGQEHLDALRRIGNSPDFDHLVALRAKAFDEAVLARKMQGADGDERAAGGQERRGALSHDRVAASSRARMNSSCAARSASLNPPTTSAMGRISAGRLSL